MAQLVVFDTGRRVTRPEDFASLLPTLSIGSIFYHTIDARRRAPPLVDDFRVWLESFGDRYAGLRDRLAAIDPYFTSLVELRTRLADTFRGYFADEGAR